MSLINKMLRDLEARQPESPPDATYMVPPLSKASASRTARRLGYIAVAIALVSGGAIAGRYLATTNVNTLTLSTATTDTDRIAAPKMLDAAVPSADKEHLGTAELTQKLPQPTIDRDDDLSTLTGSSNFATVSASEATNYVAERSAAKEIPPAPPTAAVRKNAAQGIITSLNDPSDLHRHVLEQARQRYREKNYHGVIALLQPHLNMQHETLSATAGAKSTSNLQLSSSLYQQLALAQLHLQRNTAAAVTLKQGSLATPADVELHMLYARVLLEQGEIEAAYTLLRDIPQPQLSSKPDFYALRAALARQHGIYTEATELYALLCQLSPARGDWRLGLAISQHQSGKLEQALFNYQQAAANPQLHEDLRTYAARQAQLLLP